MRKFFKISESEFKKAFPSTSSNIYRSFPLPSRGTSAAAGYDFFLVQDLTIPAGATVLVPTGVKAAFPPTEFLLLALRSSAGIKHHLRLSNQIGIIDADYYNNPENEGQIFYSIENLNSHPLSFKAGDHLIQGIFLPFRLIDDDAPCQAARAGKYHV